MRSSRGTSWWRAELLDGIRDARAPIVTGDAKVWLHGERRRRPSAHRPRGRRPVRRRADRAERRPLTIEDRALFIYTSGTTGLPKAANINHYRLMLASHAFAGVMDTRATDRMYDCLPMYHTAGGVVATGAVLINGGSVVIREKILRARILGRHRALGLHAVPVYRRALPLSRSTRRRNPKERDAPAAARVRQRPAARNLAGSSSAASTFRRSSSSTRRPKATSRCSTSRARKARSAACRGGSRCGSRPRSCASTSSASSRCAMRRASASNAGRTRPAR